MITTGFLDDYLYNNMSSFEKIISFLPINLNLRNTIKLLYFYLNYQLIYYCSIILMQKGLGKYGQPTNMQKLPDYATWKTMRQHDKVYIL